MKVVILDKQVRKNIALFKHLIHRQAEKTDKFFQTARKVYQGYINCKTGEMRFADLEEEALTGKEWKAITIQLHPTEEGAFEVVATNDETQFNCSELTPEGYALLSKTLHVLNQIAFDPKRGRNPFWILKQVAILDLGEGEEEKIKSEFILAAWHNVDRLGAEELLVSKKIGTYLFRKSYFAQILESVLNTTLSSPAQCLTLTYRASDEKIGETTLVFHNDQWLIFDDDLMLLGKRFGTIQELLNQLGPGVWFPLKGD